MNSWRVSLHIWPVAVSHWIAANHSSRCRLTSRAKACRCVIAACITSRSRGFGDSS
jgi:hypothetical protein